LVGGEEMASRPELVEMQIELGLDPTNKSIEEMTEEVKIAADKKFDKKRKISWNWVSDTLRQFMINEYDYVMKDKDKNLVDYKGRRIK